MQRRNFLRSSGIFAAGIYAGNAKAIAGPFQPGELLHNIPADKKLDPSWVRSLSKRDMLPSTGFNRSITPYFHLNMIITNNKVVSINYVLKDELGNLLQGNDGFTQEEYLHGADNILPGLERALEGLKQDQVIDIVIYPEEAYGPKEVSLVIEVAHEDLEDPAAINEGEYIELFDGTEAIVVEKNDDHIIVDANHPLAGQTLYYTVKVSGIRDATEEEIINGEPSTKMQESCGPEGN